MLIRRIEKFLRQHKMAATKFGRRAAHDPRFVLDLRMGRIPRTATQSRTDHFMTPYPPAAQDTAHPRSCEPDSIAANNPAPQLGRPGAGATVRPDNSENGAGSRHGRGGHER